jgi:hypothetical protein
MTEWGIDADLLLDALNLCYTSTHGKQVVAIAENQFDGQAAGTFKSRVQSNMASLIDSCAVRTQRGQRTRLHPVASGRDRPGA